LGAVWLGLPLLLLLAGGCQHGELARREAAARMEQLGRVPRVWGASEQSRPEKLERMGRHARWYFEHQAEGFDRNTARAGEYVERDLQAFEPRMQRAGRRVEKAIWAKPETIEETFILLFY
jgi:hypothetical protein